MRREVDVLVIGAGQAGLAIGYFLSKHALSYLVVDAGARVGDVWRNRYDSLVLFTPRRYDALPGMTFPGEQDGLPSKDEVADYLEAYAAHFSIPIQLQTGVQRLERAENRFKAVTNSGEYWAEQVVIATGPFQQPYIPRIKGTLAEDIFQIHSADYRSPRDLPDGSVLVVGGGNTGVQLAVELAQDREVYLSLGEPRIHLPLAVFNKSIFWWFDVLGILRAPVTSRLGRWLSRQKDPVFGWGAQLKQLVKQGRIQLAPKVAAFAGNKVLFQDNSKVAVNAILWCTGYTRDYAWVNIPGVLNEQGVVIQRRGVSPISGLYFLGLPWQYCRGSALLAGVGRDAVILLNEILRRKRGAKPHEWTGVDFQK